MATRDDIQELLDASVCPHGKEEEFVEFADLIIDVAKQEMAHDMGGQSALHERISRLQAIYAPLQARDSELSREIDSARKTAKMLATGVDQKLETNMRIVTKEFVSLRNEIDARIDALSEPAPNPYAFGDWAQDIQRQVKDLNDAIGRLGQRVGAIETEINCRNTPNRIPVATHEHNDLNRVIDMVCRRISTLEKHDREREYYEFSRGIRVPPSVTFPDSGWAPPRPFVTFGTKNGPAPECKPADKPADKPAASPAPPPKASYGIDCPVFKDAKAANETLAPAPASAPQGDREAAGTDILADIQDETARKLASVRAKYHSKLAINIMCAIMDAMEAFK